MTTTCVIVDDEFTSRMALKDALTAYANEIFIEEASSVSSAIEKISKIQPDLVFLDIELGDGTGFDVLEQTSYHKFHTIFITAYNQYAIKAFRINAVDYLLKPINFNDLNEAIAKFRDLQNTKTNKQISLLLDEIKKSNLNHRICLPTNDGFNIYEINSIIRCESSSNYCVIYFHGEEKLLIAKTLKELEEELSSYNFQRVHHSHLVNMQYVKQYNSKNGGHLFLKDGTSIPVSHRKKSNVIQFMQNSY